MKAKMKTARSSKSKLPKGFKVISGFGDSWHPTKAGASLIGKMVGKELIKWKDKKTGEKKQANKYEIATDAGSEFVFESAGLRALSQVKKGQRVAITFLGVKKLGGGRRLNEYEIGVA